MKRGIRSRGGIRSRAFQCANRCDDTAIKELEEMPVGILKSTLNLIRSLQKRRSDGAWDEPAKILSEIIREKE